MLHRTICTGLFLSLLVACSSNATPKEQPTEKTLKTSNPLHQSLQKETTQQNAHLLASTKSFTKWKNNFKPYALNNGIDAKLFDQIFKGMTPDPEVIKLDKSQPEFTKSIWDYLNGTVSPTRIKNGNQKIIQHKETLAAIEEQYQVDAQVIVAIWGMESGFGRVTGNKQIIRSLATLAYDGRRTKFAQEQLIAALKIIQNGDIKTKDMLGSWAGAMGQTQFIPTTYLAMAVDFDQDGHRNIWTSIPDALASTANYLAKSNWQYGETWGHEVKLPTHFDYSTTDIHNKKSVATWQKMGIVLANGKAIPPSERSLTAAILLPAGSKGPAFMVYRNFFAIMRYNNSTSYALAVSLLMDSFKGKDATIKHSWPINDRPLSKTERIELQKQLNGLHHNAGYADGIIGANTRQAIRQFQKSKGLPADGYPTHSLLRQLKKTN